MEQKKYYIWQLASFLVSHNMTMSSEELAEYLNRNKFLTSYGTEYEGGRRMYKLIAETFKWLDSGLNLNSEVRKVAIAYVKPNGDYA